MAKNMKHKISVLLTKLGDRDTFPMAAQELEAMAREIDPAAGSLQPFISVILSADTGDKPAVRKHCVHLLSVLSLSLPSNTLSPFLPKILTRITRRLRDPDSSIRSACVAAVSALSSRTTKQPFSSAFLKPLADTLFTEQEPNAQIGAALCLAAAIDAASDPDPARLGRVLLPRLEKLVKYDAFKAKAAGLVVIGSVIGSGAVSEATVGGGLKGLLDCLLSFLVSEDWAARKAAAEALGRLAGVERDSLAEFKARCLRIFESRKYDKVKAVREVMNEMIEAWKQVPDISEDVSPPRSNTSSKEDASDGRYPSGSKVSSPPGTAIAKMRRPQLGSRWTPPESSLATTARKRTNIRSSEKRTGLAPHTKPNVRRTLDWKAGAGIPNTAPLNEESDHNERMKETGQIRIEKVQKFGGIKSISHPPASSEKTSQCATATEHVLSENQNINCKGFEDLSLIRNQLVQIEQQQSSLMDLLQRFIGSSQNGMCALETRVHGLELALDEISYDLAVSSRKMATGSNRSNCCLLPAAGFIRPKFWRKTDGPYPASRLSTYAGTPSAYRVDRNGNAETMRLQDSRLRLHGGAGFIVNPLAEIHSDSFVTNGPAGLPRN